jgi:hypothetical protein
VILVADGEFQATAKSLSELELPVGVEAGRLPPRTGLLSFLIPTGAITEI